MSDGKANKARPLSPHVMHYKPMLTMMLSILHRITGAALYFGTFILVLWLMAVADGPDSYDKIQGFLGSWFGRFVLFGYTWALIHHLLGGIRHFIWDTGKGFDLGFIENMAVISTVLSIGLTLAVWVFGYYVMGAL